MVVAIVASVLTAGWGATIAFLGRMLKNERREAHRHQDLLLSQLLHVVGKPWNEAPADEARRLLPERDDDLLWSAPEQHTPIV